MRDREKKPIGAIFYAKSAERMVELLKCSTILGYYDTSAGVHYNNHAGKSGPSISACKQTPSIH